MSSADTTSNTDSGIDVLSLPAYPIVYNGSLSHTSMSSHYFSEVEDIGPLLNEYTEPGYEPDSVTLGKRPFAAVDGTTDSSSSATSHSRPAKRARLHPGRRDSGEYHLTPVIAACIPAKVDHLPYGVQWELARVCATEGLKVEGKKLVEDLNKLDIQSNVEGVPAFYSCLNISAAASSNASAKEREVKIPWKELDIEEECLSRDPYGIVGGNADKPDWVGGRVHFEATLQLVSWGDPETRSAFELKLEAPVMGSSNRFARRFGSSAFMRVQVPNNLRYEFENSKYGVDDVVQYFSRPFILHHHVFRAFYAKDGHVFLYRTRERFTDGSVVMPPPGSLSDPVRQLSIDELITWHNNIENNKGQSMSKWAARFALGLSNSVPGLRIDRDCIEEINDIVCRGPSERRGKVPSEMVMTDGCGLTSRSVIRTITDRLGWRDEPTAIQMRVAGAKGIVLLENPMEASHEPSKYRIRLRPSQIKIDLSSIEGPMDPAMLVVDVIKPGRLSTPSRLSEETIINLAENGVPLASFTSLMKDDLQARVDSLTQWTPPAASPYTLYRNLVHADGVITQRLIRESAGMARARGLTRNDMDDNDKEEDEDGLTDLDELLKEQSTAWWADPTSGCPSTISETVLVLLDSGFLPDTCPVLSNKLKHCVRTVITQCRNRCHITVPKSCTAFVVPDPCNVLAPNEIHVKSSSRNLVGQDGTATDLVLGEVLVTRHPCKVPTDVQKVTAVYKAELSSYVDVIVVSVNNHCFNGKPLQRHLASMTGGGDYDGDTLEVFWDPILVSHFKNADPVYAQEPDEVQAALSKNPESVRKFLQRTSKSSDDVKLVEMQQYLLGSLRNVSRVGTYSNWWKASAFKNGYAHPDTIYLAYMFTNILDGAKTGVSVSDSVYKAHKRRFGSLPLPWEDLLKNTKKQGEFPPPDEPLAKRAAHLPPFVLQELYNELMRQCAVHNEQLDKLFPKYAKGSAPFDAHLAAPWLDAVARAEQAARVRGDEWMGRELKAITAHVAKVYDLHAERVKQWTRSARGKGRGVKGKGKGGPSFTDRPIEQRQDTFRELSRAFEDGPTALDDGSTLLYFDKPALRRLCASYAYIYDRDKTWSGWSRFPWDVAMRTLCQIKVEALGGGKTLTEDFYYKMTIPKSFVKQS